MIGKQSSLLNTYPSSLFKFELIVLPHLVCRRPINLSPARILIEICILTQVVRVLRLQCCSAVVPRVAGGCSSVLGERKPLHDVLRMLGGSRLR
jgi:hypothetical protein